jgi:hypothetical protein
MTILRTFIFVTLLATTLSASAATGQGVQAPAQRNKQPTKPAFKLKITRDQALGISLRAKNAKLSEIAAELARELKIPVALSPVMSKQSTSTEFVDLLLEPAMQLLAPVVYIDYQLDSAPGSQPQPLGIYLYAYNEQPPPTTAVVPKAQMVVIEGNTEEEAEDDPIQVTYKNGKLTVKAKDRPLIDILSSISSETNIALEADPEVTDTVSVNLQDVAIDDAIVRISPHLRLYFRLDLFRNEKTPLLIVLVPSEKKS